MDQGLDTGDIIYQRIFSKPEHFFVDDIADYFSFVIDNRFFAVQIDSYS